MCPDGTRLLGYGAAGWFSAAIMPARSSRHTHRTLYHMSQQVVRPLVSSQAVGIFFHVYTLVTFAPSLDGLSLAPWRNKNCKRDDAKGKSTAYFISCLSPFTLPQAKTPPLLLHLFAVFHRRQHSAAYNNQLYGHNSLNTLSFTSLGSRLLLQIGPYQTNTHIMSYGGGYGGGRNGGGGYSNGYDTTGGGYGAYNYDYTGQYATYGYASTSPSYGHLRLGLATLNLPHPLAHLLLRAGRVQCDLRTRRRPPYLTITTLNTRRSPVFLLSRSFLLTNNQVQRRRWWIWRWRRLRRWWLRR